jgi:glycosyltransferase involved in cell wall biosynthesis
VCLSLSGTLPGAGGPHVGVVHDVLPLTNPEWFSPAFVAWYRIAVGRNARRAERIITVSDWSAGRIADTLDMSPDRIRVAPQGASPFDSPASAESVAKVRDSLGIRRDYVLATGWGDPRKNASFLQDVMRAWRSADAAAPDLVVVGRPRQRVHGETPPADDALVVTDADDETLRALYTGATVFAFPSLAEGFGRPPLEAACCDTPSVVAPYEAAREVLGDGAIIQDLEIDGWVRALRSLATDARLRADLVARGRTIAASRTWDAAAVVVLEACHAAATVST